MSDYAPPPANMPAPPPVHMPGLSEQSGQPSNSYRINVHGIEQGPFPVEHVRDLARRGELRPTDPVSYAGQQWIPANNAPAIFSEKSYVTAALLSFFLGAFAIDRFYLGYTGLAVAKLFLGWLTLGLWPLIDFILILLRKVPDSNGRPLR